ncbi:transposase [Salmonella enterica subsp. arizonae]|nr:transposase [Salmonella enterica subsp. arizonae]
MAVLILELGIAELYHHSDLSLMLHSYFFTRILKLVDVTIASRKAISTLTINDLLCKERKITIEHILAQRPVEYLVFYQDKVNIHLNLKLE